MLQASVIIEVSHSILTFFLKFTFFEAFTVDQKSFPVVEVRSNFCNILIKLTEMFKKKILRKNFTI